MKRILMLLSVAAMMAAAMALSGVAQAKPISGSADAKCAKLAIKTPGASFNPSNYTLIGGTEGPDVFCGFGGDDSIEILDAGDILLGGAGNDFGFQNAGTFNGETGDDSVVINFGTISNVEHVG